MEVGSEKGGVELNWLGHAGFFVKNSKVIYIDPFNLTDSSLPKADFILLTHSHYDHCSIADMEKVIKEGTKIVCTADCQSKIARFKVPVNIKIVEAGQELDFGDLKLVVFPAYNTDKHFHPQDEGWVGYLVKINDVLIYHAGDTDVIPEMQKLTGFGKGEKEFIALLPVGGRYTMTAEEAFEAAKLIKPNIAIPMHYGSVAGSEEDAKEFVELCEENGIKAMILEKR